MDTPTTSTTMSEPVTASGRRPLARIGLVGAAAAAVIAVGILAAGAIASPGGLLAAGSGATSSGSGELTANGPGGPFGGRSGGMHGFRGITITAITGSSLSLETADGWTRTITVDDATTYTESGEDVALSDLSVGDEIAFRQTLEDDGTWTIDAVAVIPPHAGGTVTAVTGSTITVERRDGTTATIKVTADTTYRVSGDEDASLADVEVGMLLMAEGSENGDGSLTATAVRALDPDTMPGNGGHGFRGQGGPGGAGPWGDGAAPDAPADGSAG